MPGHLSQSDRIALLLLCMTASSLPCKRLPLTSANTNSHFWQMLPIEESIFCLCQFASQVPLTIAERHWLKRHAKRCAETTHKGITNFFPGSTRSKRSHARCCRSEEHTSEPSHV